MQRLPLARALAITVLVLLAHPFISSQAQPTSLTITASIDIGDYVTVTGRVLAGSEVSIPEATVAVMALDPFGSAIHISRIFTDQNGTFSIKFTLTPRILVGKYTIHITASKEGYVDGYYTISFPITAADFALDVNPTVAVLEQGEIETFNVLVTVGPGFNETITVTLAPHTSSGIMYALTDWTVRANASLTLFVRAFPEAKTGNYTITIVGSSLVRSRSAQATLIIVPRKDRSTDMVISFAPIVLAVGAVGLVLLRKRIKEAVFGSERKLMRGHLAAARALVKLEELKAMEEMDDETYLKLKRGYEEKLRKRTR